MGSSGPVSPQVVVTDIAESSVEIDVLKLQVTILFIIRDVSNGEMP